jgi:hypothetical protein
LGDCYTFATQVVIGVPRPGGVAGKLGDRYEIALAVWHALACLRRPDDSLTLEEIEPELADGAEFTYRPASKPAQMHQTKRQLGNRNNWTVAALERRDVFIAAAKHVGEGRRYHFTSQTPTGGLKDLCDMARQATSAEHLTQVVLNAELAALFTQVSGVRPFADAHAAWVTLRGTWFVVRDEDELQTTNALLAEHFLEGASGPVMASALGDLLVDSMGLRMTRRQLLEGLQPLGISPRAHQATRDAHEAVGAQTQAWCDIVQRDLLEPSIERSEPQAILDALQSRRLVLVVGGAGGGKTAVVHQAVERLTAADAEVLAFRLDHLDSFASTSDLGTQLGLATSPASALALAADGRDAYLVIDQLDAVSMASGRMPERFEVIDRLIKEALALEGVRIILSCRQFDVENDYRIRQLNARPDVHTVAVADLSDSQLYEALSRMGLDATSLLDSQRELLRTPLHLVLLDSIASGPAALHFRSRGSLFDAFWDHKRGSANRRRSGTRFNDVLTLVARRASARQSLWVDIEELDEADLVEDANVLVSERVLLRDGYKVSFFHETFFDYAFARQWVRRDETVRQFLTASEQALFRRSQVRQVLEALLARDRTRFRAEVEDVLTSSDVRFHIKEAAVAVFANIPDPQQADFAVAVRVSRAAPSVARHLWQQLSRPAWFDVLLRAGAIAQWLDDEDVLLRDRGAGCLASAVDSHTTQVVAVLRERRAHPDFAAWVRWVAQACELRNREVFELVIDAVRSGAIKGDDDGVWLAAHGLGKSRPSWALELIDACFVRAPNALRLDEGGKVSALSKQDYGVMEQVREAAEGEPDRFIQLVVPFLLKVMAATAREGDHHRPTRDMHFGLRSPERDERDIADVLFGSSIRALETVARTQPHLLEPLVERLENDPHDAAQYLLYRTMAAGADHFATHAAILLLEGDSRLWCGYYSNARWVARQLVAAISPHLDNDLHRQLEEKFRDLRPPGEVLRWFGTSAFAFLSAMRPERLSALGMRRLEEYRRKFGVQEPEPPTGVVAFWVGSPIRAESARRMKDEHWLNAMRTHATEERERFDEYGGARELSSMLKNQVVEDPRRFAMLALEVTGDIHPAYASAFLWGFGEAEIVPTDVPFVLDAIRHLAALDPARSDRWLGYSLRRVLAETPLDIVELVLVRALNAPNPALDDVVSGDEKVTARSLYERAINTDRGSLMEYLGYLLSHDPDGTRTAIVAPHLLTLAADPVLGVRTCVAEVLTGCLLHARPKVVEAFARLVDADDVLLATHPVQTLMIYIGSVDAELIDPVLSRMLASSDMDVQRAAGVLAAFAALEWERPELMAAAKRLVPAGRRGVAELCAARLEISANGALAQATLIALLSDEDAAVREEAAGVVNNLRGREVGPHAKLLKELIGSPAYPEASRQLCAVLEQAVDEVDALVMQIADRYLGLLAEAQSGTERRSAGDVRSISRLVIRGLAQSANDDRTSKLLDVLDRLLEAGVYGIREVVEGFERT